MNQFFSKLPVPRQEASLERGDLRGGQIAGVSPAALDELLHELRQPLSTMESLAYYLELTAQDDKVLTNARRIQGLVLEMNRILARASTRQEELALKTC